MLGIIPFYVYMMFWCL